MDALHEFAWFGARQASACLFGALMLALLFASWRWYPAQAVLSRYDFVTLVAVALQAALIVTRLESREEVAVILLFHIVGTAMEIFKTAVGSWTYPEPALLRIGGVPLFSGFMYASVGSYIARAWRLFDLRFSQHPPLTATAALAAGIYVNFFSHHYLPDLRPLLFAGMFLLFGRTWVHYRVRRRRRRMPLLLGFLLIALFIWFAENAGTLSRAWLYPAQRHGWTMVPPAKLGAWLLLLIISYVMVSALHRPGLHAARPRSSRAAARSAVIAPIVLPSLPRDAGKASAMAVESTDREDLPRPPWCVRRCAIDARHAG